MTDETVPNETPTDSPEPPSLGTTGAAPADVGEPSGSPGSFVFILIAALVLAGGVVYVLGAASDADQETAVAETRAQDVIEAFDSSEFTSEFEPDELALADEQVDAPTPTTDMPEASDEPVETTPPTTIDSGLDPGDPIDPADIVLAFVNRIPGDDYETVGYLDREGERHMTGLRCTRLDLNKSGGICLAASGGLTGNAYGLILDTSLVPSKRFGLNSPSRAAVSPDGEVVAWTGFTLGHSYLAEGEFATITQLISVERTVGANLEVDFLTKWDGERYENPERNYWGVSFVDSDLFFATLGADGTTSIIEGRVSDSTLEVVFENASCPEVSADGTQLVAKEQRGEVFQLVLIDIASGERRDLGETRSVDDQVEWLDSDTILYALPNAEEGTDAQPVFDIWAVDVTPGATPRLVVPFADSPAA